MASKSRYYIKQCDSGSWSVFERGSKKVAERFCVVPQVTLYYAKRCCVSLNAGRGAWDWLGNVITWDSHYSVVALRS